MIFEQNTDSKNEGLAVYFLLRASAYTLFGFIAFF